MINTIISELEIIIIQHPVAVYCGSSRNYRMAKCAPISMSMQLGTLIKMSALTNQAEMSCQAQSNTVGISAYMQLPGNILQGSRETQKRIFIIHNTVYE